MKSTRQNRRISGCKVNRTEQVMQRPTLHIVRHQTPDIKGQEFDMPRGIRFSCLLLTEDTVIQHDVPLTSPAFPVVALSLFCDRDAMGHVVITVILA